MKNIVLGATLQIPTNAGIIVMFLDVQIQEHVLIVQSGNLLRLPGQKEHVNGLVPRKRIIDVERSPVPWNIVVNHAKFALLLESKFVKIEH